MGKLKEPIETGEAVHSFLSTFSVTIILASHISLHGFGFKTWVREVKDTFLYLYSRDEERLNRLNVFFS